MSNLHILLGLLRVEDCFAAQLLRRNGVSADYLREQVSNLLETTGEEPAPATANPAVDRSAAERKLYGLEVRVIGLLKVKHYQGGLKLVDDAIADPSLNRNQTTRTLVQIASAIARIIGDCDLARRYCELRLACDPDNAMALYELADCLALQGEVAEARKFARKSYELSLARSGVQGEGLAELIENRFPGIKLGGQGTGSFVSIRPDRNEAGGPCLRGSNKAVAHICSY